MEHSGRFGASGPEPEDANGAAYDALRRLERRLDRASDAAERLLAEAATGAAGPRATRSDQDEPGEPPPAGWQRPEVDASPAPGHSAERELLGALLAAVRDLIPPELRERLAEALRELLLALRALIDWYLERFERRATPVEVQDIPIV
ncbi:MAG: hypothetical protein ABSG43_08765 [Solirubrobacteraceae bacterium]|jgi:hypothetical protein